MKNCITSFVLLVMLAVRLGAANIYVRQGATGSNNGTDYTNAYTTFPAMSAITRGDIIYICKTSSTLTIPTLDKTASGTTRITIKCATIADHGTSVGWSDSYAGQAVISKVRFDTGYWTLDGQSRSGPESGYGFLIDGHTSPSSADCIQAGTTAPSSCPGTTIRYVEIYGSGDQTDAYQDAALITPATGGSTGMTMEYCYAHDFGSVVLALRWADGFTLQYCVLKRNDSSPTNHAEGIVLAKSDSITIRYNLISDMEGTAYIATPYGTHNTLSNILIYGNVFEMPASPQRGGVGGGIVSVFDCDVTGVLKILNNTIVGMQSSKVSGHSQYNYTSSGITVGQGQANTSAAECIIQNNLWDSCEAITNPNTDTDSHITSFTYSHCAYYNTTNTADPDSTNKQVLGSTLLPSWNSGVYTLSANTNAGASLGSPYNVDGNGVTRTTWTRGAYEFISGIDAPSNPRRLSLFVTQAL